MKMVSEPCHDGFLHQILVKSSNEKVRKYRWPNGAHQKKLNLNTVKAALCNHWLMLTVA